MPRSGTEAWLRAVWVNVEADPRMAALIRESSPDQLTSSPGFLDIVIFAAFQAAQESTTIAETFSSDPGVLNKIISQVARGLRMVDLGDGEG